MNVRNSLVSLASVAGFFAVWEGACFVTGVSDAVLPRPTEVLATLTGRFPAIAPHLTQTLFTTLVGFVLGASFGLFTGIALGWSRLAYAATYPIIAGLYSIPKAAFVPLLVLWFGAGAVPAVLAALIGAVLPVAVNVANGISTVEPELEGVLVAQRASRLDIVRLLAIPHAIPAFLAALKIAFSLALVGSVVSEMTASNKGLGNIMMIAISGYDTPLAFSAFVLLGAIGSIAFALITGLERHFAFWAHRRQNMDFG